MSLIEQMEASAAKAGPLRGSRRRFHIAHEYLDRQDIESARSLVTPLMGWAKRRALGMG